MYYVFRKTFLLSVKFYCQWYLKVFLASHMTKVCNVYKLLKQTGDHMKRGIFILYLCEVINTLLEGVHNDVIQLCQSF